MILKLNVGLGLVLVLVTFRVSGRRREMYIRHVIFVCASVCLPVCLSIASRLHYRTDPDVTWGNGRGAL